MNYKSPGNILGLFCFCNYFEKRDKYFSSVTDLNLNRNFSVVTNLDTPGENNLNLEFVPALVMRFIPLLRLGGGSAALHSE